ARSALTILVPLVLSVATLYLARDFFIPLALAILISFLLMPFIKRLERWHFNRVTAVLTVTMLAFAVVGGMVFVIAGQLIDLANDLPKYKSNLQTKVAAFKISKDSPLTKASETIRDVTEEIGKEA